MPEWHVRLALGAAMAVSLAGCVQRASPRAMTEMSPAEIERLAAELQAVCRARGIGPGERAFDDCVRDEARARGLVDGGPVSPSPPSPSPPAASS